MRILHLHSGNLFGGIERILLTLPLHSHGLEHHFALCWEAQLAGDLQSRGAPVHRLKPAQLRNPLSVWRTRQSLRTLLSTLQPDALIVHSFWSLALFGAIAKRSRLPLIFWMHIPFVKKTLIHHLGQRHKPDLVLAVSQETVASVPKIFRDVRTELFYAPVARPSLNRAETRARLRRELSTPEETNVILQASRMEPWKGHEQLLQALADLKSSKPWVAWIAGGPATDQERQYFQYLGALCVKHGLGERVRFLGHRSDIASLMTAADLFCQPNIAGEGFSIVFVEAALASLPIITSRIGGALELLDEHNAMLVPSGDLPALRSAIKELLEDSVRRQRLGQAGYQRAIQLCDPERQLRQLARIVKSLKC
ncbi:MAG: glycosyltransferase family 4 protein [Verrucomicrobiota bacterium]|nr:glycosyltransferase family 4 protein [Verrucomicrobiota bacterium]